MIVARILSALVLAPLVLGLLFYGSSWHIFLFMLPLSAGLSWEWWQLNQRVGLDIKDWGLSVVVAWGMLAAALMGNSFLLVAFPGIILAGLWMVALFRFQPSQMVVSRMGYVFTGIFYCSLPLVLTMLLFDHAHGREWLIFLLGIIWSTDIGAFFVGRLLGRRKLAPSISPGKTWAGLYGGTILALISGWGLAQVLVLPVQGMGILFLALLLSLLGQVGDLAESMLKREAGVKDSGNIIPGHGGLLDRLDSLLFTIPALYFVLSGGNFFGQ